jgi:hypothetical protein
VHLDSFNLLVIVNERSAVNALARLGLVRFQGLGEELPHVSSLAATLLGPSR